MKAFRLTKPNENIKGFTLIEVLAAIAIMAFVLPSLMLLMMQQTDYAGSIRERTIAHWIADNKASELRLNHAYLQQLQQRESSETVDMAGLEWTVEIDVEDTVVGALVKYRIEVSRENDQPLVTLETYLDKI